MAVEHMVWMRFRQGVSERRIADHLANLADMARHVPAIETVAVGRNFTERSGGYTHGLIVTVASRDKLPEYLEHPHHVKVATPLKQDAELLAMDIEH